ncbi:MAG: hypothetical protein RRA92_09350 [Gemmatimonadota bacterium]|nr:hypothetical protein [Gemmatimonadota bacterium]
MDSITRAETFLRRGPGLNGRSFGRECPTCVVVYSDAILAGILENATSEAIDIGCTVPCRLHLLRDGAGRGLCLVRGRPGAPMAAVLLEELVALGFREFFTLGPAGHPSLGHGSLAPGDVVLVDRARIHEGTSAHYSPGRSWSRSDPGVTDRFAHLLGAAGVRYRRGAAASTDGLYRETPELIRSLVRDRVLALDMELSALFTVAAHHAVPIAAAVYVTDIVSVRLGWQAAFHADGVADTVQGLIRCLRAFLPGQEAYERCS